MNDVPLGTAGGKMQLIVPIRGSKKVFPMLKDKKVLAYGGAGSCRVRDPPFGRRALHRQPPDVRASAAVHVRPAGGDSQPNPSEGKPLITAVTTASASTTVASGF
jgi:hypothetical protein